ncbi:O-antigen polymerase [Agrococcus citreus]|uniref:O-antigen polymerase n=1 Tax=Agrococcus citreus TaxID=84643 RepID=UPI0031DEBB83
MSVTYLLLASIFGVRPLVLGAEQEWSLYGANVEYGTELAARIGLVATVALTLGLIVDRLRPPTHARTTVHRVAAGASPYPLGMLPAVAISAASSVLWFLAMAVIGGGFSFVRQLASGRSAEIASRLEGVPVLLSAIPVAGVIVLCVARMALEQQRPLAKLEQILFLGAVVLAALPPLALGNRRLLLPVALAAVIAVCRPTWNRIVPLRLLVPALAIGMIIAALPFVRSAGSRVESGNLVESLVLFFQENGLGQTVRGFFVSYDTEMFDYIALVAPRLGDSMEFGGGRGTLGELLLQPIPAALSPWPTWSNTILTELFGGGCATVACPVPSVVGVLYFDLGIIGVAIGMLLLGLYLRTLERRLETAQGAPLVIVLTIASFMPSLIRGNTISQLWIAFNVLIVALALRFVLRRLHPERDRERSGALEALPSLPAQPGLR